MNLKQVIIILLIFVPISLFSQFSVEGRVVDKNNKAIEFANVILKNSDIIFAGTISDTSGNFIISNISKGSYLLCFSTIGYADTCVNIILDTNIVYSCQLNSKINTLKEIEIVANRPAIAIEGNKTIVTLNKQILDNLETSESVFKYIPGMINTNSGYQIFGKDKPLILINGKQSSAIEINAIQPQNIIKIESFNNTGQYDASVQHVINIITKNHNYIGSQVYNALRFSSPSLRNDFRVYITINKNKFQQSFLYSNEYGYKPWFESSVNKVYNDSNIIFSNEFDLKANDFYKNHNLYYALNFSIDTSQNIGLKLNADYGLFENENNFTSYINNDTLTNITNENKDDKTIHLTINYDLKTKNEHFLSIIYDTYYRNTRGVTKINQTLAIDTLNSSNKYQINSVVVDYSIPLKNINSKFSLGGKLYQTQNENDVNNFDFDEKNSLNEEVYATYVVFSNQSFSNFNFEMGLRNEYYIRKIINLSEDSSLVFNENKLFPSLSVNYKFNSNFNFSLDYKNYIDRSSYSYITNQNIYINPYLYKIANATLKPDIINSLFLSTAFYNSIQLSAGYKNHTNYTTMFFSNKDSVIVIGYDNTNKKELFVSLSLSAEIGKSSTSLNINATRPFFKYEFLKNEKVIDKVNYSFSINNTFSITKKITSDFSLQYSPSSQFDLFNYMPMLNLSIGLRKYLLNKNLRLSLFYNYNLNEEYTMQFMEIELLHKYSRDKNMFLFSVLYHLNFEDKWINNYNGIESELYRLNN